MMSVVIPVYNGAPYIQRSVKSALNQVGVVHEVIVIDDGSTDGSGELAEKVDPGVRVIRTPNAGQAAARNRGIKEAKGEIVAFLDADDWWSEDKLASQASVFASDAKLDVVITDFTGVDTDGRPQGWQGGLVQQLAERGLSVVPISEFSYIVSGAISHVLIRYTSFMHPSAVAVRKALLNHVGGFDESMTPAEDYELWIRLGRSGHLGLVGRNLVTTEARSGSQGRRVVRMNEQLLRVYSGVLDQFPELPTHLREHVLNEIRTKHIALGWHYRTSGDMQIARRHYRAALKMRPRIRTLAQLLRTYLP